MHVATLHADELRFEEEERMRLEERRRLNAEALAASEDDSEEFPMRKTRRSVSWAEELDLLHEIPFESDEIPDDDRGWK